VNTRTSLAQRDEIIRRTVYVSDIDHQVCKKFELLHSSFFYFFCVPFQDALYLNDYDYTPLLLHFPWEMSSYFLFQHIFFFVHDKS
jgi:hypothetical protein